MINKNKIFILVLVASLIYVMPLKAHEIHEAASKGDLEKVKMLLEKDAKLINLKDKNSKTPLHFAAQAGHKDLAELLIKEGADLHAKNINGAAPIHYAAFFGHKKVAGLLIDKGADINARDNLDNTPLSRSVSRGHKELVNLLIDKGVEIITKNDKGRRMLHDAASGGHKKLVDLMIRNGADINSKSNSGGTLLHSAASGGLVRLVEMMIAKNVKINERDKYGFTPIHLAASGGFKEIIEILIKKDADMNIKSFDGWTPLNYAQNRGSKEIVDLLIKKGADKGPVKFPVLKGEYLGQIKPGLSPEIFAPGIVSTSNQRERDITFSPDLKEFYFSRDAKIHVMKKEKGVWKKAEVASFSGKYFDFEACFTPDGRKIFFISRRPKSGSGDAGPWEIWYVERELDAWSSLKILGSPFEGAFYPTFTKEWVMYYTAKDEDLYCSKFENGKFSKPKNLGKNINTAQSEYNSFIAADESYIIFSSLGWGEGSGGGDLFISFRNTDGTWTKAKNMGPGINSSAHDYCPSVSPDGKYFFFASSRLGNDDIYWVDARVIEQMKPKGVAPPTQERAVDN